ncbi:MAG: hypothetical protein RLY93_00410 [Sumerlaeia bacterium]
MDWPSIPDEMTGKSPPLIDLLPRGDSVAACAELLIKNLPAMTQPGDRVEYQVVAEAKHRRVTLPALMKRRGGEVLILTSHAGNWRPQDIANFVDWLVQVRTVGALQPAPIHLFHDIESLPPTIEEALSMDRMIKLAYLAAPYIVNQNERKNAEVFAKVFEYVFEDRVGQRAGYRDLERLDAWRVEDAHSLPDDTPARRWLIQTIGAFLGELIIKRLEGAAWSGELLTERSLRRVRIHRFDANVFGAVERWLINGPPENYLSEYALSVARMAEGQLP